METSAPRRPFLFRFVSEHSIMNRPLAGAAALCLVSLGAATPARALQPLSEHLAASGQASLEVRDAELAAREQGAEHRRAWMELLPTAGVRAAFTFNQYPSVAPVGPAGRVVIVPEAQRDLFLSIELPIVDVGRWLLVLAAARGRDAAEAEARAVRLSTEGAVARAWHQVVAAEAVLVEATRSSSTAEENLAFLAQRRAAGVASQLDVERASAEVERARQLVAEAALERAVARRTLASVSGLEPSPGSLEVEVALAPPPALGELETGLAERLPGVIAARLRARSASARHDAAKGALLPTLSATGVERFTNAAGFGQAPSWQVVGNAEWKIDLVALPVLEAEALRARRAEVAEDRALRDARDALHRAWHRVVAQVAKARAARAEGEASALAARLARERQRAGIATTLEVITAERDALSAQVSRIRADAELALARVELTLTGGASALVESAR
jgi:outer membrane protein TolC